MTVSQTETTQENSPAAEEERIRKIYVKDVKNGGVLHTVFKAVSKEKHSSRSGKSYLAVSLVDKTGQIDARVFENVEPAEAAFAVNDYLLVKGKVGVFQGKLQLVIDRLERLDPEPIDPVEFDYVAPPEPVKPEAPAAGSAAPASASAPAPQVSTPRSVRQRVLRLLDDPRVVQALEVLLTALEGKGAPAAHTAAGASVSQPGSGSGRRRDRRDRGPRVERKPGGDEKTASSGNSEKPELKRDPGLPAGLSFKPLTALVGDPGSSQS